MWKRVLDGCVSIHCRAEEETSLHAREAVGDIHLSKAFRAADGLGIKQGDSHKLGHNGGGQANVHKCQYARQ